MAAKNTIGSRIVIEGEKEYNAALKRIKDEQKELRSEMQLCTEKYKENANTAAALTEKQDILSRQIDKQAEAVVYQKKKLEMSIKAQQDAKEHTEKYAKALEEAEKKLQKAESGADATTEALEAQKKEVVELNKKLILSRQEYEKNEAAILKNQTALNGAEAALIKLQNAQEKTNRYLKEANETADKCAKSIDIYGNKVNQAEENTKRFEEKTHGAFEALATAIVASGVKAKMEEVMEVLADCSEVAAEFETSMNKVYTIADEAQVMQADMSNQILRQSSNLYQSANAVADATYNALSAGVETQNAVGFAAEATKLAVGGFTDVTTSVDILTTALNAYDMETEKATEVSDMLITTQNLGKTTVKDLAANMGRVIPLAAAYNVDMANLSATYAELTANGIKTAEATTYIKSMLNELGDSGSKVSSILQKQTGKSFAELMSEGYSLGEVLDILSQSVNGDSGAFNELWSSSEAGIGALSLLGSGVTAFNQVLQEMESSAGATQSAFDKMVNSTEYAKTRLTNAIDNLKIAIGEQLNPEIKNLYNTGANAFDWATEFVQKHPEMVKAISAVVAAIGGTVIALGALTAAVMAFKAILTTLMGPAQLIVTLIVAAGAALAALIITQEEEQTALEKEMEATRQATAARQERIDAINEEQEALDEKLRYNRELIQSIATLNEKEELTKEEMADLAARVAILNESMPQLNLAIDEETGKLEENTEAFLNSAKAAMALEEASNAEEIRIKRTKEMIDIEKSFTEEQEKYNAAKAAAADAEEEYNRVLEEAVAQYGYTMGEKSATVLKAKEVMEQAKEAEEQYKESLQEIEAQMSSMQEDINNLTDCIEAVKDTTYESCKVSVEYKGTTQDVTVAVAESMKTLETAYCDAKKSAEDSLKTQVGLFEELSTESELTAEEMARSLQSQTEVFNQYKDDMLFAATLVENGLLDEGLLGSIQDMGIDGAGYLHELVETAQTDAETFATVQASYIEMLEAREELSATMGDIISGYSNKADDLLGVQTEKYGEMVTTTEESYADMQTAIEEALASMVTTQQGSMEEMVSCVTEKAPELEAAAAGLGEAAVNGLTDSLVVVDDGSSEVFRELGHKIPESVAQGIREGQELVSDAVQEVIDNAVAEADLTGISEQIDRLLGQALQ